MCLAIPGRVEWLDAASDPLGRNARVRFGPVEKQVNVSLVPGVGVGDYVLVHVGVAIQTLDAKEAERVFELLEAMVDVGAETGDGDGVP